LRSLEKEFLELISNNQSIVHKVCGIYTDNEEDHKDLFQEIIEQVWISLPRFKGNAKITTWMYKVALHTAIALFRKKKRYENRLKNFSQKIENDSGSFEESEFLMLDHSIGQLSKADKGIILLYLENFSYIQIGEIIGITENNVGVKLNRIKKKLKEIYNRLNQ